MRGFRRKNSLFVLHLLPSATSRGCSDRLSQQKRRVTRKEPLWGVTTETNILGPDGPNSKVRILLRSLRPRIPLYASGGPFWPSTLRTYSLLAKPRGSLNGRRLI